MGAWLADFCTLGRLGLAFLLVIIGMEAREPARAVHHNIVAFGGMDSGHFGRCSRSSVFLPYPIEPLGFSAGHGDGGGECRRVDGGRIVAFGVHCRLLCFGKPCPLALSQQSDGDGDCLSCGFCSFRFSQSLGSRRLSLGGLLGSGHVSLAMATV